jgi:hypothetical protein
VRGGKGPAFCPFGDVVWVAAADVPPDLGWVAYPRGVVTHDPALEAEALRQGFQNCRREAPRFAGDEPATLCLFGRNPSL